MGHILVSEIKKHNASCKMIMISMHESMLEKINKVIEGINYHIFRPFTITSIRKALKK